MENENHEKERPNTSTGHHTERQTHKKENPYILPVSILIAGAMISGTLFYSWKNNNGVAATKSSGTEQQNTEDPSSGIEAEVLPSTGVVLPVVWGDLGQKLASLGVIDKTKFENLYKQRGQYTDELQTLLNGNSQEPLKITKDNSAYVLNLLWALGLGNKNDILENGEMTIKEYGGAQNFASTGGWTLADGNPMNHYSKHKFFNLTAEQQSLVDKISRNIYRPCCGNSTHFPDCNHGMAMLGLLELMASQGVSEQDMYKAALAVNSFWFPNNYVTIATYFKSKGIEWKDVRPQDVLGANYSSSAGYQQVASQTTVSSSPQGGSGCDVGGVAPAQQSSGGSGCGI